MKVKKSLSEYIKEPLTKDEVACLKSQFKKEDRIGISITVVLLLTTVISSDLVFDYFGVTVFVFLMATIPSFIIGIVLAGSLMEAFNAKPEFLIDDKLLMGGDVRNAMKDIDDDFDTLKTCYKAPDAIALIEAIENRSRPLIGAEKNLLNQLESAYKDHLYETA